MKYRTHPMWMFWKNLRSKYMWMCRMCTNYFPCEKKLLQQWGCYRARKEYGMNE